MVRDCLYTIVVITLLAGCGSGSSGSSSSSSNQVATQQANATEQVLGCRASSALPSLSSTTATIDGVVSYQFVPVSKSPIKLDFDNSLRRPIRFAHIEAIEEGSCQVVASTESNNSGSYSIAVPDNIAVKIRVVAHSATSKWQVTVADNTQSGGMYAIYGGALLAADAPIRDLHADTGWDGSRYNAARLAAPFYLLDQAVNMFETVNAGYAGLVFEPLHLYWSVNNSTQTGDDSVGKIGSSKYYSGLNAIYLLGKADDNTDEFDINIVNHELAHFVVDSLGRSDGLGGEHSLASYLDPRSAYSEGIATAVAALITGDDVYVDTGLPSGGGWSFGVDDPADGLVRWHSDYGWYNEGAITELIYDLFDQNNEGLDIFSLSPNVLFSALSAQRDQQSAVTIFSLLTEISAQLPAPQRADLQSYAAAFGINSIDDALATKEFNATQLKLTDSVLPIYTALSLNDDASLCFDQRLRGSQPANKLTAHRMINLTVNSQVAGEVVFDGDLTARVYSKGVLVGSGSGGRVQVNLSPGKYVVDLYQQASATRCYDVSVGDAL